MEDLVGHSRRMLTQNTRPLRCSEDTNDSAHVCHTRVGVQTIASLLAAVTRRTGIGRRHRWRRMSTVVPAPLTTEHWCDFSRREV